MKYSLMLLLLSLSHKNLAATESKGSVKHKDIKIELLKFIQI